MERFFIPDNSPLIRYDPVWTAAYVQGRDGFDEAHHVLNTAVNASFSFNVTGTSFTLYLDLPSNNPCTSSIRINSSEPISACTSAQRDEWHSPAFPLGRHHVEYTHTASRLVESPSINFAVATASLDAIRFRGISAERPLLDPRRWINTTVDDSVVLSSTSANSTQQGFRYSNDGGWTMQRDNPEVSNGTLSSSTKRGAQVNFTGIGSAMYVYGKVGPEYGTVSVSLDGQEVESAMNLSSPWPISSQLLYFTTSLEPSRAHTISLTNLENKMISVDNVVVAMDRRYLEDSSPSFASTIQGKIVLFGLIPSLSLIVLALLLFFFFPSLSPRLCQRRGSSFRSKNSSLRSRKADIEKGKHDLEPTLRPYWMEDDDHHAASPHTPDLYPFAPPSAGLASSTRSGALSSQPSSARSASYPRERERDRDRLNLRTTTPTSSFPFFRSPRKDTDAISTRTGYTARTDRTRDLVISYEAGKERLGTGVIGVTSPSSEVDREKRPWDVRKASDLGKDRIARPTLLENSMPSSSALPVKPHPFATTALSPASISGSSLSGSAHQRVLSPKASVPTFSTAMASHRTFGNLHRSVKDGSTNAAAESARSESRAGPRSSAGSWSTLLNPIAALLARGSYIASSSGASESGKSAAGKNGPSARLGAIDTTFGNDLLLPTTLTTSDQMGKSTMTPSSPSMFTTVTDLAHARAEIAQWETAKPAGARYISKDSTTAQYGTGNRVTGIGNTGHPFAAAGRTTEQDDEADIGMQGAYGFQSSLPANIHDVSPIRSSYRSSHSHTSPSLSRGVPEQHRRTISRQRQLPPLHPFAAANQANRSSCSPPSSANRSSYATATSLITPRPDLLDADADAISTRGAPPSVRSSFKTPREGGGVRQYGDSLSPGRNQFSSWRFRSKGGEEVDEYGRKRDSIAVQPIRLGFEDKEEDDDPLVLLYGQHTRSDDNTEEMQQKQKRAEEPIEYRHPFAAKR